MVCYNTDGTPAQMAHLHKLLHIIHLEILILTNKWMYVYISLFTTISGKHSIYDCYTCWVHHTSQDVINKVIITSITVTSMAKFKHAGTQFDAIGINMDLN